MTLIPELREELSAMLDRDTRIHRRRRRWFFGLTPVVLVASTTAALAAGGVISIGSPAKDPPAVAIHKPTADSGSGVAVAGTERVLALRTQDPDGGPPWGLRISSTTRGLECVTLGRVVNGRLGVYGRYGAFDDDGRLHPFPHGLPGRSLADCTPLDARGRLFINVAVGRLVASADRLPQCLPRVGTTGAPEDQLCPEGSERTVLYGALGPEAKSVTYASPTGTVTVPTSGPEGAYLIVLPAGADAYGGTGASRYPRAEAITEIAFRDGRTCSGEVLRSDDVATRCPLPGFSPPEIELPTREEVGARVTATARQGRRFWVMRVKFRARVAVEDATAAYNVRIFPPHSRRGSSSTAVIQRNIKAGERVEQVFEHLNGGGECRIVVSYHRSAEPGTEPMGLGGVTVGRFRLKIP